MTAALVLLAMLVAGTALTVYGLLGLRHNPFLALEPASRHGIDNTEPESCAEARRKIGNAVRIRAEGAVYGYRTLDGAVRVVVPRGVRLRVLRGLWKRELVAVTTYLVNELGWTIRSPR